MISKSEQRNKLYDNYLSHVVDVLLLEILVAIELAHKNMIRLIYLSLVDH